MLTDRLSLVFTVTGILAISYILLSSPGIVINIPYLLMQVFGILLICWSLLAIRINKSHPHGEKLPKNSFFVTKGPYEIIRHPIYAGLLLFMAGHVEGNASFLRFVALAILTIVVILKIIRDESILEDHIKEYNTYKLKTHRIVPYFF